MKPRKRLWHNWPPLVQGVVAGVLVVLGLGLAVNTIINRLDADGHWNLHRPGATLVWLAGVATFIALAARKGR